MLQFLVPDELGKCNVVVSAKYDAVVNTTSGVQFLGWCPNIPILLATRVIFFRFVRVLQNYK